MVHALMSSIGSVRNTRRNNLILFSLPVVNLLRRKILERQYEKGVRSLLTRLDYSNAGRRVFQNDFLIGMGIQATVAMIAARRIFSSPRPGGLTLGIFAIFAISAALSLPFHFSQGGFEVKRATDEDNYF